MYFAWFFVYRPKLWGYDDTHMNNNHRYNPVMKTDRSKTSETQSPVMNLKGQFLIAMPTMHGDAFERAVIYVCDHSDSGALGLMINRTTDVKISDILTRLQAEDEGLHINYPLPMQIEQNVYFGGPVQTERGFVLHSPYKEYAATVRINEELGLTSSRDILEDVAQGKGPENILLALGYAGWGAGQLEEELARNVWLTVPADTHVLFETLPTEKYQQAMRLLGISEAMLSDVAGHA